METGRERMYLYLDIETIETQDPELRRSIAAKVKPPASITKEETLEKWNAEKRDAAVADAIAATVFDGSAGHIICIGYAGDDGPTMAQMAERHTDEGEILAKFFEAAKAFGGWGGPKLVGHNIAWDLRFITQRAIIHNVRLPLWWPRDIKPWSQEIFCTQAAFVGAAGRISLDRLCRTLGIPGKGAMSGSGVKALWDAGQFEAIGRYCMDDVELVRAVHRRMRVVYGEIDAPVADDAGGADDDAAFLTEVGQ